MKTIWIPAKQDTYLYSVIGKSQGIEKDTLYSMTLKYRGSGIEKNNKPKKPGAFYFTFEH